MSIFARGNWRCLWWRGAQAQWLDRCFQVDVRGADGIAAPVNGLTAPTQVETASGFGRAIHVKHAGGRMQLARVCACLAYLACVVQWITVAGAAPAMVADKGLAFSIADVPIVLAVAQAMAVAGKAVASHVVDTLSPKPALIFILVTTSLSNALFVCGTSVPWFCFCFGLTRFVNASAWVTAKQLMRRLTPAEMQGASMGSLAFASRLGSTAGMFGFSWLLLHGFQWHTLFQSAALLGSIAAAFLVYFVPDEPLSHEMQRHRSRPRGNDVSFLGICSRRIKTALKTGQHNGIVSVTQSREGGASDGALKQGWGAFWTMLRRPSVRLMLLTRCFLQLVIEFQVFIALFGQSTGLSPGLATRLATWFSAGAGASVLTAGFLYCALTPRQRTSFITALCGMAVLCLACLAAGARGPALTALLLLFLGASIGPAFYVPIPEFNVRHPPRSASALEGCSETITFSFAILFDLYVGGVAGGGEPEAWTPLLWGLTGIMTAGMASMHCFMRGQEAQGGEAKLGEALP
ncbi:unnamed protein product [Ostreobium quekettii]|uniref:Uncharacterized protein n=1 Tax=Ostreobium quekettii TaxID=121088 RepID=A0A8S1J8Z2_9CHLO|nr:unnamed protein product [Ostreobium quekettii]|eukprot:evm.model.scf_30EXC.9 EVM.evm.TU.scf_30EXC.9   scf_30EXC:195018-199905(-)